MITQIPRLSRVFYFGLLLTLVLRVSAAADKPIWTCALGEDSKWENLTGLGVLLIGTDSAIQCIDPETGKVLWKNATFKKSTQMNAREISGTPYLLCNQFSGVRVSVSGDVGASTAAVVTLAERPSWSLARRFSGVQSASGLNSGGAAASGECAYTAASASITRCSAAAGIAGKQPAR